MALPVQSRDILRGFYDDTTRAVWARDLVGLVIQNNGSLTNENIDSVLDEILNPPGTLSVNLHAHTDNPYPKIEINKLSHAAGVNALAANQSIDFCSEGHTYIFGQNGSGKSGFFHLINQMAGGEVDYPILGNVYSAPQPKNVTLEYMVDGAANSLSWDCITQPPAELQHIRLFDSKYAEKLLKQRDKNEYVFRSYCLNRFESIARAIKVLKELGANMGIEEIFLNVLCQNSYSAILVQALQNQFTQELCALGMDYLNVQLEINNLLEPTAEIKISIVNAYDPNSVLSEAEKKCATLALFLAEYELLEVKQPLVFDDPVNSMDTNIIQHFANRLAKIEEQVILFTHNAQLLTLLKEKDDREFKIYASSGTARSAYGKIHVLIYDMLATSPHEPGFVLNHKEHKSKHYLDEATSIIDSNPVLPDTRHLVDTLRIAVEFMVDEVVFYNQHPLKFRGVANIPWAKLETMAQFNDALVRDLHTIYDKLSNAGSHVGFGGVYNPLTRGQLEVIKNQLLAIRQIVYP